MKSFRRKIRHSALALVMVLLVVFSVLVYWSFEQALNRYVDSRLMVLAGTLGKFIKDQPNLLQASKEKKVNLDFGETPEEEQRSLRAASHSILVLSLDGKPLWKGASAVDRPSISDSMLAQVQAGAGGP